MVLDFDSSFSLFLVPVDTIHVVFVMYGPHSLKCLNVQHGTDAMCIFSLVFGVYIVSVIGCGGLFLSYQPVHK